MTQNTDKTKQKQQLTKMLIFGGLGILFCVSMYFIFMPSADEQEVELQGLGLNDAVPQATNIQLPEDKAKAYEEEWYNQKQQNKQEAISSLANFFEDETAQDEVEAEEPETDAISHSVNQYKSTSKVLDNFYAPSSYEKSYEQEQLKEQVAELEAKLARERERQQSVEEQMDLVEKSYQMAAKYMPQGAGGNPMDGQQTATTSNTNSITDLPTVTVDSDKKRVVTSLYQEVPDSVFMEQQLMERNRGFNSVQNLQAPTMNMKNTLQVCVHKTAKLRDGETISLRLLENANVSGVIIPKNSLLTALAKIRGNRLLLLVNSLAYNEQVIGVKLSAFEIDGQEGVFITDSQEMNAVKEIAANVGTSSSQSFNFSSTAGQQIAADLGKGLLQGTSTYIDKKLRDIKVTLKTGHLLYLMQTK